jgi:integrase
VFTREDGSALNPDHVSRRFRTLAKRAGVPVIRFHDLRHTSISLGLERGVDIKVMSERVGHSSSWFTADTYAHVGKAQAREAGERIGSVISLAAIRAARDAAAVAAEIEETDVSKM